MTTTDTSDRFTTLPDDQTLAATVVALEEHGFSVEMVDDLAAARNAVLARIPHGSSVMTNTSVTLHETGIADAINDGGQHDSARNKMSALDFATQAQEMKVIGASPTTPSATCTRSPRRDPGHCLGLRQPARLLRLGCRQCHLRRGHAEARPDPGISTPADLPTQPDTRGRPRAGRLRAAQLRGQGPRDPPGTARPHPRDPHRQSVGSEEPTCPVPMPARQVRESHEAGNDAGGSSASD
jgi:hypothetical protein